MVKTFSADEVLANIAAGNVPIDQVREAMKKCIADRHASIRWTLDTTGFGPAFAEIGAITEGDVTLLEHFDIEAATGLNWATPEIDPVVAPSVAKAILVALLKHRAKLDPAAINEALAPITPDMIADASGSVEVKPADPS